MWYVVHGKEWRRVSGPKWFGRQNVPTTCCILACWRSPRGRGTRQTGRRSSTRRRSRKLVDATGRSSPSPSVTESYQDLTSLEFTIVFRSPAYCKLPKLSVTASCIFVCCDYLKYCGTCCIAFYHHHHHHHHHVLLRHNGSKNNTVEYRHKHTQLHPLKTHKKNLKNKIKKNNKISHMTLLYCA